MAIIDNHVIGNLVGKYDDVANKWLEPPREVTGSDTVKVDRNSIVLLFINNNKSAELDTWLASSKIVESYFSTREFEVDYNGLQVLKSMVTAAVTATTLSSSMGTILTAFFDTLEQGVTNPNA